MIVYKMGIMQPYGVDIWNLEVHLLSLILPYYDLCQLFNPYAADGEVGLYKIMQKS